MLTFKFLVVEFFFLGALALGAVRHVPVPQNGISPDVAVGPKGEVYLVFGQGKNALFAISQDGGRNFSRPVQLNRIPDSVLVGHERGPKVAVGKSGTIHIIWMSSQSDRLDYTQKRTSSAAFSAPRNLLDVATHVDGATIAANEEGDVLVVWLDARLPEDPPNPVSLPVFWTLSKDRGTSFSPNHQAVGDRAIRACSCCALKAIGGHGDDFLIAYRGAYQNVRDFYLARLSASARSHIFHVGKVKEVNWKFEACPMSGPWLAVSYNPRDVWAAGMSEGKVYYTESVDEGRSFHDSGAPSNSAAQQNHPIVLVNRHEHVFFAWEEGREIRWQVCDLNGKGIESGDAGTLPENSKATAFIDREGNFCLVF
jgi:hypothetical protein